MEAHGVVPVRWLWCPGDGNNYLSLQLHCTNTQHCYLTLMHGDEPFWLSQVLSVEREAPVQQPCFPWTCIPASCTSPHILVDHGTVVVVAADPSGPVSLPLWASPAVGRILPTRYMLGGEALHPSHLRTTNTTTTMIKRN